ncbi:MAG: hypothetical protein QM765_28370 [Myxococcales bacterium]
MRFEVALADVQPSRSFWLRNAGQRSLVIEAATHASGVPVLLGAPPDLQRPFALQLPVGRKLEAGESIEVQALALPASDPLASEVLIRASDTAPGEESVLLRLEVSVLPSPCTLPEIVDFGQVGVGQEATRSVAIENPTFFEAEAYLGSPEPQPGDGTAFSYLNDGPGRVSVPPLNSRDVLLGFKASEARQYQASIEIRAAEGCPPARVLLRGEGHSKLLDWAPAAIDCGCVLPGHSVSREIQFTNLSQRPVSLSQAKVELGTGAAVGDFVLPAGAWDAFTLSAGEQASRSITCSPVGLGAKRAILALTSDVSGQENLRIPLAEMGGGPRIEVVPESVDFGVVAFVPGAALSEARSVRVINSGESAPENAFAAALHLGTAQSDGTYGAPFIHVVPLTPDTLVEEIELDLTSSPSIPTPPFDNTKDVAIRLTPKLAGSKLARVEILSNDPARPTVAITVKAEARQMPECRYRVSPAALDFGVVQATAPKTLGFSFENLGLAPDEKCLLTVVGLASGSPDYSLPAPVQALEVAPGEKVTIPVMLQPQGVGDQTYSDIPGRVALRVSSPSAPEPSVLLQGGNGPACLAIQPTELDFGSVRPGEQSAERAISLLHLCVPTVKLHGVFIGSGAPEFEATMLEAIPSAGKVLASDYPSEVPPGYALASVRFAPKAPGEYRGTLVFDVEHHGGRMHHVLPIRGRASSDRTVEVSFVQGGGDPWTSSSRPRISPKTIGGPNSN